MVRKRRVTCRYESYSVKVYNVEVNGKWHSTHYTLQDAIKEAVKVGKEHPDKNVIVIKRMGHVVCERR